jgi:hypothetical protein
MSGAPRREDGESFIWLLRQSNMPALVRVKAKRGARRGKHSAPPLHEKVQFYTLDWRFNKQVLP